MVPSRETLGLFGLLAGGLTLIGATTYFFATRYVRRSYARKAAESDAEDFEYLSEEDDYRQAGKRLLKRCPGKRAPPLITVAELFEQAMMLEQQRNSQRKVRIYFDSNDEFVKEDNLPELLDSHRTQTTLEDNLEDLEEQQ